MGRAYVASVGIGVSMAFVMVMKTGFGWVIGSGLSGLALAWVGTTGLALAAILRGNVTQHREWMVRSYVVTFGFVTFRVIVDALEAFAVGTTAERATVASWGCWALPLLLSEMTLQGRKILSAPRRPVPGISLFVDRL